MSGSNKFEKLLEPSYIGNVQTRNRIIKTAAGTGYSHFENFHLDIRDKVFYEALARGGVGLLIVGSPVFDFPLGATGIKRYRFDDDRYLPVYQEAVEVIHKHGCPTFLQLYHAGPWHTTELFGKQPVAASSVIAHSELDQLKNIPRELSIPEIEELVDKFASAAVRAVKAGFDGVEINASFGHLLASFLSPFWNKRNDAYGGKKLENRARFLLEIMRETRKNLGEEFPISVSINGIELGGDGKGMAADECLDLAIMLQEAGANALHIRFFWIGFDLQSMHPESFFYPEPYFPLREFPVGPDWSKKGLGANLPLAARIKSAVSIPVITAGRLDPVCGEKALRDRQADFIGFCRRLMADPELPNKIASGRIDEIAPCTACKECMSGGSDVPVRCRTNANLSTERIYLAKPAEIRKRVMVIGGGPGGMEAARVSALRGHDVTIYEKEHKLGGLMAVASIVKGNNNEDMPALISYLRREIKRLGVKIFLGKEVDVQLIEIIKPDVLIIAAGGLHASPDIPGINSHKVVGSSDLHHKLKICLRFLRPGVIRWLTKFWMPVGKRVVIIGGAIQGCQLAVFLVKRGRKVIIVDTDREIGEGIVDVIKPRLFKWLFEKGVKVFTDVKYKGITDQGLTILTSEGSTQTIEADTIIPALPLNQNIELFQNLKGKVPEIYNIGDSNKPRLTKEAIAEGSQIGHSI